MAARPGKTRSSDIAAAAIIITRLVSHPGSAFQGGLPSPKIGARPKLAAHSLDAPVCPPTLNELFTTNNGQRKAEGFMSEWWNALNGLDQLFYGIAFLFTAILVIQTAMMCFGFDHGSAMDAANNIDIPHMETGSDIMGIHVLSVRTAVAFFVGFGWGGATLSSFGAAPPWALAGAFAIGLIFLFGVFYLLKLMYSMRSSGTLDYANAVGQIGSVYMAIPPAETGNGQIEVMIQGRLQVLPACTKANARIPANAKIRVIGVADPQTLLVELASRPAHTP
jgi:hypothetical protein